MGCPQFGLFGIDTWYLWLQFLWASRTSSAKGLHTFCSYFQYTAVWLFSCNCAFLKAQGVVTQAPSEGWSSRYPRGMADSGVSWGVTLLLGMIRVTHWHPKMLLPLGDGAKPLPHSSWASIAIIFPRVKQFFRAENPCTTHASTGLVDKRK